MGRMKISSTGFWDGNTAHLYHGYSRPLVNWISQFLSDQKEKNIYDFGCGTGQYLRHLKDLGFTKLIGFEGDPPYLKEFDDIRKQDLTSLFMVDVPSNVISLEVAEHIPSNMTTNYLTNIKNACAKDHIFISSWARRGQGGDGHINELNNEEAIELISQFDFQFLKKETEEVRKTIDPNICSIQEAQLPWFAHTTLIFRKK